MWTIKTFQESKTLFFLICKRRPLLFVAYYIYLYRKQETRAVYIYTPIGKPRVSPLRFLNMMKVRNQPKLRRVIYTHYNRNYSAILATLQITVARMAE